MRREDWPARLVDFLARDWQFAWGRSDCALWAAAWVQEATGQDLAQGMRLTYFSENAALRRLARLGCRDVADLADRFLPKRGFHFAGRGDIVLHPHAALGVCSGLRSHFLTPRGMTDLPTSQCTRAWAVE